MADGVEDAMAHNGGQDLLNEEGKQDAADGGEVEVMDEEKGPQLERLAVPHHFATTKNDNIVQCDENGGLLKGRHGRDTGHEAEVVGRVANNLLEGLVEDRPEVDAKRPVQRRDPELDERHGVELRQPVSGEPARDVSGRVCVMVSAGQMRCLSAYSRERNECDVKILT